MKKQPEYIVMGAFIVFGIAFWVWETLLDLFFFAPRQFTVRLFYDTSPHDLVIRFSGLLIFIAFGVVLVQFIRKMTAAEDEVLRLNSVLRAIRDVNQLITRERNRDVLLREVCAVFTSGRAYRFAAIILTESGERYIAAAESGLGEEAYRPMRESFERGGVPECYRAAIVRSGLNIVDDPKARNCPIAGSFGGNKCSNIRIEHDGEVFGLLVLSYDVGEITGEEQELVREVTMDLALALHALKLDEGRTQAEHDRERSEKRYRAIFEQSRDAIRVTDLCNRIVDVNDAWIDLFGYDQEEARGMDISRVYDTPADTDTLHAMIGERGYVRNHEVRLKRKDGSVFDGLVTGRCFGGREGM